MNKTTLNNQMPPIWFLRRPKAASSSLIWPAATGAVCTRVASDLNRIQSHNPSQKQRYLFGGGGGGAFFASGVRFRGGVCLIGGEGTAGDLSTDGGGNCGFGGGTGDATFLKDGGREFGVPQSGTDVLVLTVAVMGGGAGNDSSSLSTWKSVS